LPKFRWRIRLGAEAEKDIVSIRKWTRETFGERQADIYRMTLLEALEALASGPDLPGSTARDEILPGLRTLHVARNGRRGRHFVMYRAGAGRVIEVMRILHDAMDLARHVPTNPD
jgi:toxin ParE1/3/4